MSKTTLSPRAAPGADFWATAPEALLSALQTTPQGLSTAEADARLARYGPNALAERREVTPLRLLLAQFNSPIILILIAAALLSFFLHDAVDGAIILVIVLISGLLGFWQEYGATNSLERLRIRVQIKTRVRRDGALAEVAVDAVVPGDVVLLNAGSMVPGDCHLLAADDLFVNEAALTGETYPAEKALSTLAVDTPLAKRSNALFLGTHVVSGSAIAVVVHTGQATQLGQVAKRLAHRPPETEFEHGVRRFGYFLLEVTLMLLVLIFAINVYLGKPILNTFLFSLALAVGLTPQLLPAIISVNLARGARRMAAARVIVKRLAMIENFGSMDVLCSDKTGTLTEGKVQVQAALDYSGRDSQRTLRYAALNAYLQAGFDNPIDEGIKTAYGKVAAGLDPAGVEKLDELPYDFVRKRLSVLVADQGQRLMITKGALLNVLDICTCADQDGGHTIALDQARTAILHQYETLSAQGLRTLGVAYKQLDTGSRLSRDQETGLTFLGFVALEDPPKAGIAETVGALDKLGVALKMISGDNRLVAANIGARIGLRHASLLTGAELREMSDEALRARVDHVDIFAEVEPNQKERLILALRRNGHVVGYLGDGINDASALHAADVGISVDSAVDVAKEAAHFVLLKQDLKVLIDGVREGRRTFANTLKYVFMATSANFGNMFSMAGASLLLPFLPLLPKQILLANLLTDIPELAIATDRVDSALVERPRRWDIGFIRRFMISFGLLSSVFDFLTFGLLLWFDVSVEIFRTGWLLESVVSATLIVLIVRTRQSFLASRPAWPLSIATLAVISVTLALPYLPLLAGLLGLAPLAGELLAWLGLIVVLYIAAAEVLKRWFYRTSMG